MKHEDVNQASLLTPPGSAAIAVVRIVGPLVVPFLSKHFSKPSTPDRCVHGKLLDGDREIDDPVVVLHGDRADINLHGGEWVVRECLDLAERAGFRIADSSAELLDAQNIIEREMLAALPFARTEQALRMLLTQPPLWTSSFDPAATTRMLNDRSLWWMLNPPRIAIVGIPNVGKSTLANQLFGTQRSITADVPGTTRDWVGDWANIDGLPVHLLDTPGQRESNDRIENEAIARSEREIESTDLIILVLDPTQPRDAQDALHKRYPGALVIINKSDLPHAWSPDFADAIHTAAIRGIGIDPLRKRIYRRFVSVDSPSLPQCWTQRQRQELEQTLAKSSIHRVSHQ